MDLILRSSSPSLSVTSINLGRTTPALEPQVDLSSFTSLTSFYGGENFLRSLTGLSQLSSLEIINTGRVVLSAFDFPLSALPPNLKQLSFDKTSIGPNSMRGNWADLPRTLEVFSGGHTNRRISGNIADWPRTLKTLDGARFANTWGHFKDLPPNIVSFGISTNVTSDSTGVSSVSLNVGVLSGSFLDFPPSLTAVGFFETNTLSTCSWVWSEIPSTLKGIYFTQAILSGSMSDAKDLESLQLGAGATFLPLTAIQTIDLPPKLRFLLMQANMEGNLQFLPQGITGSLTLACSVSGTLTGIPSGVTALTISSFGQRHNTVSGNISALNTPLLTQITLGGQNTVTGDIVALKDMPITSINFTGSNTMTGNLSSLPRTLTSYTHTNSTAGQSVSGDVAGLPPNLVTYNKAGNSGIVSGNIANIPKSVTSFTQNTSNNTLSGDVKNLPPNLVTFNTNVGNNNTRFTGNILDIPRTVTTFAIGSNTLSGTTADLPPNIDSFQLRGNQPYTFSGNLSSLPSSLRTLELSNRRATVSYYNGFADGFNKKSWASNRFATFTITVSGTGGSTFPASHLATLLVDLTGAAWPTTGTKAVTVGDSSMPTLSRSLYPLAHQAIELLRLPVASGGYGVTVTVLTAA